MSEFLTIKTRTETYKVLAAVEFLPNFVGHIFNGEVCDVFAENGDRIGGNAGSAGRLHGWHIKHPDVDNIEVRDAIIRRCEQAWKPKR